MWRGRRSGRVPLNLVALGSAAILAVYATGYRRSEPPPEPAAPSLLPPMPTLRVMAMPEEEAPVVVHPLAIPSPVVVPGQAFRDGTYVGRGNSLHGGVEVTVVVAGGRMRSVEITRCMTRYPCSEIESLPPQALERQSDRIRYVSGATDSSRAFAAAMTAALQQAT